MRHPKMHSEDRPQDRAIIRHLPAIHRNRELAIWRLQYFLDRNPRPPRPHLSVGRE
jgi:hypothetical protein